MVENHQEIEDGIIVSPNYVSYLRLLTPNVHLINNDFEKS